jgi:hypothetical protein
MAILMAFAACGKYEEGPGISLRSKKARVLGEWTATSYTVNGTNQLTGGTTFEMDITDSKVVTRTSNSGVSVSNESTWEFDDKKEHLVVTSTSGGVTSTRKWQIIRLANKEMKLKNVETEAGVTVTSEITLEAR